MKYLIKSNGLTTHYEEPVELEPLQKAVGGYIELVHLTGAIMIVNEEGLIEKLPINTEASNIAGKPIVGDAVLLTGKSVEEFK